MLASYKSSAQYCINLRIDKHILDNSVDSDTELEFYLVTKLLEKCVGQINISGCQERISAPSPKTRTDLGFQNASKKLTETCSNADSESSDRLSLTKSDVSNVSDDQNCEIIADSFSSSKANTTEVIEHNGTENDESLDNRHSVNFTESNARLVVKINKDDYLRSTVSTTTESSSSDDSESKKSDLGGSPEEDSKSLATIRSSINRRQSIDSMTLRPLKRISCSELCVETDTEVIECSDGSVAWSTGAKRKRKRRKIFSPYRQKLKWYQVTKDRKNGKTEGLKDDFISPQDEESVENKISGCDKIDDNNCLKTPVVKSKSENLCENKTKTDGSESRADLSSEKSNRKTSAGKVLSIIAKERPKRNITAPRRFTLMESPLGKRKQSNTSTTPIPHKNEKDQALNPTANVSNSSDEKNDSVSKSKTKRRKNIEFVAISDEETPSLVSDIDMKGSSDKGGAKDNDAFVKFIDSKVNEISNSNCEQVDNCSDEVSSSCSSSVSIMSSSSSSLSDRSPSNVVESNQEPLNVANGNRDPANVANSNLDSSDVANSDQDPSNVANSIQDPSNVANNNQDPSTVTNGYQDTSNVDNSSSDLLNVATNNSEPSIVASRDQDSLEIANSSNVASGFDQNESGSRVERSDNTKLADSVVEIAEDEAMLESKSALNSIQLGDDDESTHEINTVAVIEFSTNSVTDENVDELEMPEEQLGDQLQLKLDQENSTQDTEDPDRGLKRTPIHSHYLKCESEIAKEDTDDLIVLKSVKISNDTSTEKTDWFSRRKNLRNEIDVITLDNHENEGMQNEETSKNVNELQIGDGLNKAEILTIKKDGFSPQSVSNLQFCSGRAASQDDSDKMKVSNNLPINCTGFGFAHDLGIDATDGIKQNLASLSSYQSAARTTGKPSEVTSGNGDSIHGSSANRVKGSIPVSSEGVLVDKKWWMRDQRCFLCFNGNIDLECAKCPRVFHCACLIPPLIPKPEGDWYCRLCCRGRKPANQN